MKKKVVIIGAGITGLTLGWKLADKFKVTIVEKEETIGGMCSSFHHNGFILDYGPHKLYPQFTQVKKDILSLYSKNEGDLLEVKKKSSIFLQNTRFNYPLEIKQAVMKFSPILATKLIMSYGLNMASSFLSKNTKSKLEESYEDFLISKFGKVMYSLVFKENAEKIWGNPKNLSADLAKTRVSSPNLIKVILNTLLKTKDPTINAESFFYPKRGMQDLMNRLAEEIKLKGGEILTQSKVKSFSINNKKISSVEVKRLHGTKKIKTEFIISTAHMKDIIPFFKPPKEIEGSLESLNFRGLALVYIFLNKSKMLRDNWIFFPEKKFIFQRISEQKGFSGFNQPESKTVITAEISMRPEIASMSDEKIGELVAKDLEKAKLIYSQDILGSFVKRKEDVYPLYSLNYKKQVSSILTWLDSNFKNFITCGRNGLFNYNNMDHCMDMATKIAEHLKTKGTNEDMSNLRRYFESYKIVD